MRQTTKTFDVAVGNVIAPSLIKTMATLPFLQSLPQLAWFKLVNDTVPDPYLVRSLL